MPYTGCHQRRCVCVCVCGFLKQVKGESTSLLVQIQFTAVAAGRAVTGARGSGSIGASRADLVYIHT